MSRAHDIAEALTARKLEALQYLFPNGKVIGGEYCVGSLTGEPGKSLKVKLTGDRPVWKDFATGDGGGDLLDLWAAARCGGDLRKAMDAAAKWLGLGDDQARNHAPRSWRASRPSDEDRVPPDGSHEPAARYVYTDENEELWIEVQRYERADGKKDFFPYDLKNKRYFSDKAGHPLPKRRPIYNLLEVTKTAGRALFVEGEKCVEAARGVDVVATTMMGGSSSIGSADLSPLAGRDVYLWPDNDEAGRKCMEQAATFLQPFGCTVYQVRIPDGKPQGWDIADAIEEGMTSDEIGALMDNARVINPPPLDIFGDTSLAGAPDIPRDDIPKVIADFTFDEAERIGVDPSMIAMPCIGVAAAGIDDLYQVQPTIAGASLPVSGSRQSTTLAQRRRRRSTRRSSR